MTNLSSLNPRIAFGKTILLFLILSPSAWSSVFIRWSNADVPSASSLGVSDIVFTWKDGITPLVKTARKQGYRVYVEVPIEQAKAAAEDAANAGCAGIILDATETENAKTENDVANLRSAHPRLGFRVLSANGKQPDMRGSLIIKRNSVLEVSSPTAQPWIDTNFALIKVEQRSRHPQVPLYTFSWNDPTQQKTLTADDYSLAVAEAGAFHADLLLQLDEHLQQGLNNHDADAWALWNQVRSTLKFSLNGSDLALKPAANVAVVVDHLDTSDEVLNLLSRHNIPFRVFLAADLKTEELKGFDVAVVFARPDQEIGEKIRSFATRGSTVVMVNAHDRYPWQNTLPVQVNEHTNSYTVGSGQVLELGEPVTDPVTFAQDIRRLLGKRNSLLSLWNGLTTIVAPYQGRGGSVSLLELVNYAAEPVRVQVQVKGPFKTVRYESPEHACCESLEPVQHDGLTEFVIPELRIAGRIHLEPH